MSAETATNNPISKLITKKMLRAGARAALKFDKSKEGGVFARDGKPSPELAMAFSAKLISSETYKKVKSGTGHLNKKDRDSVLDIMCELVRLMRLYLGTGKSNVGPYWPDISDQQQANQLLIKLIKFV